MKRYLDSNVFLYPLLYEDDKAKIAEGVLSDFLNKKFIAYTSVLTWDEFVYGLRREKGKEISEAEGEKFLKLPSLLFLDAKLSILIKAQELMIKYSLKPRDAIHAATAIVNGITEIVSDDSDFDKIKEVKRIPLEILGENEEENK